MRYGKILQHHWMLKDKVRLETYQKAILEAVHPGDIVVEIGTGTGILAFLAAKAGAAKVYAIEQNEDRLAWTRQLIKKNAVDDIVRCILGTSSSVELPEKVDVIVSEILGTFGVDENVLEYVKDVRDRFLKPGGIIIPENIELFLYPVDSAVIWRESVGFWDDNYCGYDFSVVRKVAPNYVYRGDQSKDTRILAPPEKLLLLDFYKDSRYPEQCSQGYTILQDGEMHGWGAYFQTRLSNNSTLTNAPDAPPTHWQQVFLPLERPVAVEKGDKVRLRLELKPDNETVRFVWKTRIVRNDVLLAESCAGNL